MQEHHSEKDNTKNAISRKDFIKTSALTAAGLSVVPRSVLGGPGYTPPSDQLHVACVGCGNKAYSDIQNIASTPNNKAVISHLCDVDLRQAEQARKAFPKARFYRDWRKLFAEEHNNFDAVLVAIPDHNHAIVGLNAMKLNKHLYLEKPLTHDIYETRMLSKAAKKYEVVTQMGNQLASTDGVRTLKEWFEAGLIGDIKKIYNWTNRPVWPSGIPWPEKNPPVPEGLNWDLWLGTAPQTEYVDNLVPQKWRAWWRFGTGSLGDMGCHIMGPSFKLLGLQYPTSVTCNATRTYSDWGQEAHYHRGTPPSSKIRYKFDLEDGRELEFHWFDGGMLPPRPDELDPDINMNSFMDPYFGATIFEGTDGTIITGEGGLNPQLLPTSLTDNIDIPEKYPRVKGGAKGHYWQWVEAAIAGYHNDYEGNAALPVVGQEKAYVDSPITGYADRLTETVLMGNLVLRSFDIRQKTESGYVYPGRYIEYQWDGPNMRITNFDPANQFVKRTYRQGWGPLKI